MIAKVIFFIFLYFDNNKYFDNNNACSNLNDLCLVVVSFVFSL